MTIHSETILTEKVAERLAELNVQYELKRYPHRRLWMNLLAVVLLIFSGYHLIYWGTHGFGENGDPLLGFVLLVMCATVTFYANSDQKKNNLIQMKKSLGSRFGYTFSEEGIESSYNGAEGIFEWDAVMDWWEEKDYFYLDLEGTPILIPKDQFNMKTRKALRELFEEKIRIRTVEEMKAERKAKKKAQKAKK